MPTTINSPLSLRTVLVLLAFGSCHGYQLPQQRTAFLTTNQQRSLSNACPRLHIGADFDSDFEAALGQAPLSEYEKDAEFYRKRNEQYYNSRRKAEQEETVAQFSVSDTNAVSPSDESDKFSDKNPGWVSDSVRASENSFKFVEKTTFSLLKEKPMVALAIFAATGLMVAYLSGFFFLEGYIEDWNPAENDMIPYWDDAEIHTIERALPPEA